MRARNPFAWKLDSAHPFRVRSQKADRKKRASGARSKGSIEDSFRPADHASANKNTGTDTAVATAPSSALASAPGPGKAQAGAAFARGSLSSGVAWSTCCACQSEAPALTCPSCKDVYCAHCFDAFHVGRLRSHAPVPGEYF